MNISILKDASQLGTHAAARAARVIRSAIALRGEARIILSTGASQFETLAALVREDVAWDKVTMFHLDEYIGLPESHTASFRRYLKERFTGLVPLKEACFVDGEGDVRANIRRLSSRLREAPVDLGLIGIGENGHIAFNDPPADFETDDAYLVVTLDDRCKRQQMGEGWFMTAEDVPDRAVTMSVREILRCRAIISCVPGLRKAEAVLRTLARDLSPDIPATALKGHPDWSLYIDEEAFSLVRDALRAY